MPKEEILANLKLGDFSTYEYLFSKYYNWLCNYVYKLCKDQDLAEDIVQETFINLWEKRNCILINTSIKNYLFKSCYHRYLQHVKNEKSHQDLLDTLYWETTFYAKFDSEENESYVDKLSLLIEQLPPKRKEIFIRSKIQKMKYKEIAIELGISIRTVEVHISKALRFLKENTNILF